MIEYLRAMETDDCIKLVIGTAKPCFNAKIVLGDNEYFEIYNKNEPFDLSNHVFMLPKPTAIAGKNAVFCCDTEGNEHAENFVLDYSLESAIELYEQMDNGLRIIKETRERIANGVEFAQFDCIDKHGAPVKAFSLFVDLASASLYVGTPNDSYESVGVCATLPEMIDSALAGGVPVVAAVNADFFDMFGDCHPSGLCVKNGIIISNVENTRPFIAIKNDGSEIITTSAESPELMSKIAHAVAGMQIIVKDGQFSELALLEPFSYVRHPRTAAGITADGKVILTVVDGRIPEYSNGASLVDLAKLMIHLGANKAINLDGGGSSAVYVKNGNRYDLRSNPADLIRPRDKLIRKEFNSILVIEK